MSQYVVKVIKVFFLFSSEIEPYLPPHKTQMVVPDILFSFLHIGCKPYRNFYALFIYIGLGTCYLCLFFIFRPYTALPTC